MSNNQLLVRAKELSGQWTVLGTDALRGIVVEDPQISADDWGWRDASFTLRRSPRAIWPDLGAFTDYEIEEGGHRVFEGRVKETPMRDSDDRQIQVNLEGWQAHGDDDVYQRTYVETDLSRFQDQRSLLGANLANARAGAIITTDPGVFSLSFPRGFTNSVGAYVGVTMDLGPDNLAKRVVMNWKKPSATASAGIYSIFLRGHDTQNCILTGDTDFTADITSFAASGTDSVTFTTPRRYVSIFIFCATSIGTIAEDNTFQVTGIGIYAATAYESGNASILKASDIVKDARDRATLLWSTSNAKISATSFSIPEFSMSTFTTPRETIKVANAFHDYQARITAGKVLEYRPRPSKPILMLIEGGGAVFEDASANSGQEIYSDCIATATGPDGVALSLRSVATPTKFVLSAIQMTNPTFAADATNWTNVTRDAVTFDSAPASGLQTTYTAPNTITTSAWTGGTFVVGRSYVLTFRANWTNLGLCTFEITDTSGVTLSILAAVAGTGAFQTVTMSFTPISTTNPTFVARPRTDGGGQPPPNVTSLRVDSFSLLEGAATLVQRRGFKRTKVLNTSMSLTTAALAQLAATFLVGHSSTPLKGTLSVPSSTSIQRIPGGAWVKPSELTTLTGELILFPYMHDPDTGAIGRVGRIASVTCDLKNGTATCQLDNETQNLDAVLSRLAVVTGQVR